MKHFTFLIATLFLVIYLTNIEQVDQSTGQVAYVIDGDTLRLEEQEASIRLWGVDAPERGRPGAQEATEALQAIAGQGTMLSLVEVDQDRYGRLVARLYLQDGREVNQLLIESGAAAEYCRYSKGAYGHC